MRRPHGAFLDNKSKATAREYNDNELNPKDPLWLFLLQETNTHTDKKTIIIAVMTFVGKRTAWHVASGTGFGSADFNLGCFYSVSEYSSTAPPSRSLFPPRSQELLQPHRPSLNNLVLFFPQICR